jgi:hypothetical protein
MNADTQAQLPFEPQPSTQGPGELNTAEAQQMPWHQDPSGRHGSRPLGPPSAGSASRNSETHTLGEFHAVGSRPKPDHSVFQSRSGAGDEARTRDPYLGKVPFKFCIRGGRNRPLNEYSPPLSTGLNADRTGIQGGATGVHAEHNIREIRTTSTLHNSNWVARPEVLSQTASRSMTTARIDLDGRSGDRSAIVRSRAHRCQVLLSTARPRRERSNPVMTT